MSDYHALLAPTPHTIHHDLYPTIEEQRNIIRAYVEYRPLPYVIPTESSVREQLLTSGPRRHSTSTVNLDRLAKLSKEEQEAINKEVDGLVADAKNWRASASCQWALWGIVQANVPGVQITENGEALPEGDEASNGGEEKEGEEEEEDEFDYIKYAEQKAMIFWGDMLIHGLVSEEELADWSGTADFKAKIKSLEGK